MIPQLIHLEDDTHVWAATFERAGEGVFAIQAAVADSVAAALALTFRAGDRMSSAVPATSGEAFDPYLRGLYFLGQATAVGYDSAAHYLELAIAHDSTFAAAFAALGQVYGENANVFEGTEPWFRRAEAAGRRAIALDSSLADAWHGLSRARYSRFYGFDHEEAVRYLRKALVLNPNASDAHEHPAFVLTHVGMLDEADREVRITLTLDPLNRWAQFRMGQIALARSEYDAAATELSRLPTFWAVPYTAEARVGQERPREALELLAAIDTLDPARKPLRSSVAAMAHARLGDTARALEHMRMAEEGLGNLAHGHHVEYNIGAAYALLGEHELALAWFRRAVDGGFPCLPAYQRAEFLGSLAADARYGAFLDSLKAEGARLRRSIGALLAAR